MDAMARLASLDYNGLKAYALISRANKDEVKEYLTSVAQNARAELGDTIPEDMEDHELVERIYHLNGYENGNTEGIKITGRALKTWSKGPIEFSPGTIKIITDRYQGIKVVWFIGSRKHRENGPSETGRFMVNGRLQTYESWHVKDALHRVDAPAFTVWNDAGDIIKEEWYFNDRMHNEGGPAHTVWNDAGLIILEKWYLNDEQHRVGRPALTEWNAEGDIIREEWYLNDKQHREDGPAVIEYDGDRIKEELWYLDGESLSAQQHVQAVQRIIRSREQAARRDILSSEHGAWMERLDRQLRQQQQQPQQPQQLEQQRQQRQTEEEYSRVRDATNRLETPAHGQPMEIPLQCVIDIEIPHKLRVALENTLIQMQEDCALDIEMKGERALLDYFRAKRPLDYVNKIDFRWTDKDGNVNTPRYFFNLLSKLPLTEIQYTFKPISGQMAIDAGGVSRAIFTKAGEYINRVMKRPGMDRLYVPAKAPKGFGRKLAHVVSLALMQGRVLGTPLSYGLLNIIQYGGLESREDIKLSRLLYLYNQDNPSDLEQTLKNISDESLEFLIDVPVPGYLRERAVTAADRLEWLKRYLYMQLYGSDQTPALLEFSESLLKVLDEYSLLELAEVLGYPLTKENMLELLERSEYEGGSVKNQERLAEYLFKYIGSLSPKQMTQFLVFGTGAADPMVKMSFQIIGTDEGHMPSSHTCANQIDFPVYSNYEKFKKAMDYSILSEDFSNY